MNLKEINKKLIAGFFTLTFRRATLYAIRFATINLILARILSPATIGIFNIANSILAFFTFFSDIGLAAAVIQKKQLDKNDLKTTFTIQTALALLVLVLIWFSASFFASIYSLEEQGMWLIRALAFGFFLTSLKVLPSVLLERELRFTPLVLVEIVETIVFSAILIWFSFAGSGINSFSFATIAQSVVGVCLIYIIAPWRISIGFSKDAARTLLNFGVPFQINSILALVKDRLVPLVIAHIVGPLGVGFITWAQSIAFLPLEVLNIVVRITFPAFSRLQEDKQALKEALEHALFMTSLFLYPMLFGLLALAPSLVNYVVSPKWQSALPLIYLFAVTVFWASFSTLFTNVLNSIGKIGITLKLMLFWTILTWLLSPLLSYLYGFIGAAYASAIISFTSIVPILIIKRIINVSILKNVWQQFISSLVMAVIVYSLAKLFVVDFFSLIVIVLLGTFLYFGLMLLLTKNKLFLMIKEFTA